MTDVYSKADLQADLAEKFDLSKVKAGEMIDFLTDTIVKKSKKGDVRLFGFGTFSVRKRAARTGRNPKTGEELKVKPSKTLAFKPGKAVKDAL